MRQQEAAKSANHENKDADVSIQFVYFDLGNILVSFDNHVAIANVARAADIDEKRVRERVYDSGLQDQYEHGELSDEAYAQEARARLEIDAERLSTEAFLEAISAMFVPIDGMAELVQSVRSRLGRVGLLSNTCDAHWQWIRRQPWTVSTLEFDSLILSYEVGAMKPNEAIYMAAEEGAGIDPQNLLFIDDKQENIDAAKARGWQARQCFGGPEAIQIVNDFLS